MSGIERKKSWRIHIKIKTNFQNFKGIKQFNNTESRIFQFNQRNQILLNVSRIIDFFHIYITGWEFETVILFKMKIRWYNNKFFIQVIIFFQHRLYFLWKTIYRSPLFDILFILNRSWMTFLQLNGILNVHVNQ